MRISVGMALLRCRHLIQQPAPSSQPTSAAYCEMKIVTTNWVAALVDPSGRTGSLLSSPTRDKARAWRQPARNGSLPRPLRPWRRQTASPPPTSTSRERQFPAPSLPPQPAQDAGLSEGVNCRTIPGQGLNIGSPLTTGLGTQDLTYVSNSTPGVGSGLSNVPDIAQYSIRTRRIAISNSTADGSTPT